MWSASNSTNSKHVPRRRQHPCNGNHVRETWVLNLAHSSNLFDGGRSGGRSVITKTPKIFYLCSEARSSVTLNIKTRTYIRRIELKTLAAQLFHPARLPGSRGSGACSKIERAAARSIFATCRLKAWMNIKLGSNAMNKTLGAHASQLGLS